PARAASLARLAADSRARQAQIEAHDEGDFDHFLARYFAQTEAEPVTLRSPFAPADGRREERA
ncbi:MAG: hypothetical protein ACLFTD_09175, partial [Halochromatium sp.]